MPVNYDKISVSTESTSVKCKIAFRQPIRKGRGKLLFSVRQMPPEAMFTFSSHTDGRCQIPKRCSWEMLGVSHHCLQSRRLFVQLPRKQLLSNTKAINIYTSLFLFIRDSLTESDHIRFLVIFCSRDCNSCL